MTKEKFDIVVIGAGMTANQLKGVIFSYPGYASDLASMV